MTRQELECLEPCQWLDDKVNSHSLSMPVSLIVRERDRYRDRHRYSDRQRYRAREIQRQRDTERETDTEPEPEPDTEPERR